MSRRATGFGGPLGVARATVIAVCASVVFSCERDAASPAASTDADAGAVWPAGTVLAVNDLPIRTADVDAIANAIAVLYPQYVFAQCRRLALTNVVLPMWAVRSRDAEERLLALERCRAARIAATHAEAIATEDDEAVAGGLQALGLDLWVAAGELEPGVWSEPVELIGRWALIRIESVTPGEHGQGDWFELTLRSFPYLDFSYPDAAVASTSIEHAVDRSELEIVSPEWRELIPEEFKFRMRSMDSRESHAAGQKRRL